MTTPSLMPSPRQKFTDTNGKPLANGMLFTYAAGTSTPLAAFQDAAGTVPHANPIRLDARGEATVYFVGNYKIDLKSSAGSQVTGYPVDNFQAALMATDLALEDATTRVKGTWFGGVTAFVSDLGLNIGSSLIGFLQTGAGAVVRSVREKLHEVKTSADNPTWGSRNAGVGLNVLGAADFVGVENTAFGSDVLKSLVSGFANAGVGVDVLSSNTTGAYNQGFGVKVLFLNTTGSQNCGYGTYSLGFNSTGGANSAYGVDTCRYNTTGGLNSALGVQALYNNITGSNNVALGAYAARGAANPPDLGPGAGPSPNYGTAVGANAFYTATGDHNTGLGFEALYSATGAENTAAGSDAGFYITSGVCNAFLGRQAGGIPAQLATASNSVGVGAKSGTTGSNAVAVGYSATAAASAVAVGANAAASGANAIAIGNAVTAPANTACIGNAGQTGLFIYGGFQPQTDNSQPMGGPTSRWSVLYAGTGVINTSDEREKQQAQGIDAAVLRAWAKVNYRQFKFNDAVALKGSGARWHFGVMAQQVKAAFESEGLDAFAYGLLCYDEWAAKDGTPSGNRYGVRYEEALALECAYLRSRLPA